MDFIERWLGVQPDAGTGMSEVLILTALLAVAAGVAWRRLGRLTGRA